MISTLFLVVVVLVALGSQFKASLLLRRRTGSDKLLGLGVVIFCLALEVASVAALVLHRSIDTWSAALRDLIWASALLGVACVLIALVLGVTKRA